MRNFCVGWKQGRSKMEDFIFVLEFISLIIFEIYLKEVKKMSEVIYLNADDEEPDCGRCIHFVDNFDCSGSCGPEHGWYGYEREVLEKDEE